MKRFKKLNEEIYRKELAPMLDSFVSFASNKIGLKSLPTVRFKDDSDDYNSFAAYNPSNNELSISTKHRHPMDVFRSVAHELVHHKQNEEGRIGKDIAKEGDTGSDIENEANAEAGKIMRWFAKENPNMFNKAHIVEENLQEGINDPGKMKAIFLAGGPGSGKDFVMNSVLQGEGLREVNSDIAFEFFMKKHGLDMQMPDEEKVERNIVRGRSKKTTRATQANYLRGRLGVIINGTADDIEKIKTVKKMLEYGGYETMMVFVNTTNDVSRQRNVERGARGGRKVPDGTNKQGEADGSDDIRTEKWISAQQNIGELQKVFGNDRFAVLDNSVDTRKATPEQKEKTQAEFDRVRRMSQQFVRAENKNPQSQKWIEQEAQRRGITKYEAPKRYAPVAQPVNPAAQPLHKPDNIIMAQARRLGLSYYGFGRFGRKQNGKNTVLFHSQGDRLVRVQNVNEAKIVMSKKGIALRDLRIAGKKKVNEAFKNMIDEGHDTHKMEWGTDYLRKDYEKNTPGSVKKMIVKRKHLPEALDTSGFTGKLSESIVQWVNNPNTQAKFAEKYGEHAVQKLEEAALRLEECGGSTEVGKTKKSLKALRNSAKAK